VINIFAPRKIQAVRVKTDGSHVTLRKNFSHLISTTEPVKSSRDAASLAVCTWKKLFY